MIESLRRSLLRLLRIPEQPHLPPGEEAHARVFLADPAYYRLQIWAWLLRQGGALLALVVGILWLKFSILKHIPAAILRDFGWIFWAVEGLAILSWLVQVPLSFLLVRWDYACRFYVLTDRCLRIQEGLWTFREQTFTLANIQNLDVRQNPLQRFFGLSDLVVRTAGGGDAQAEQASHGPSLHEGVLRGLADASAVKAHVLARMKAYRDAGLGDPGDPVPQGGLDLAEVARAAAQAARDVAAKLA